MNWTENLRRLFGGTMVVEFSTVMKKKILWFGEKPFRIFEIRIILQYLFELSTLLFFKFFTFSSNSAEIAIYWLVNVYKWSRMIVVRLCQLFASIMLVNKWIVHSLLKESRSFNRLNFVVRTHSECRWNAKNSNNCDRDFYNCWCWVEK